MEALKEYKLAEIPRDCLKVWGRTTGSLDPLAVFWTGGGIEVNVKASELWLEVEAGYDRLDIWASVLVNGAPVSRQMLEKRKRWLCLFRGMDPNGVKNVRFLRDSQAMSDEADVDLLLHGLKTDGSLEPVRERPYKLEFIGDSITSGEGIFGAKEEMGWIPMFFSSVYGYPFLVSSALDAECRILSQSGWGMVSDWQNNPHHALPRYYTQVCGLLNGKRDLALGAQDPNDFQSWQPDAVIVNLGTNDAGALGQPAWTDPATGKSFRQRQEPDGTVNPEDARRFQGAVIAFLKLLREKNPRAHLVWAFGFFRSPMLPLIRQAVCRYQKETGDENASFLLLPETTGETVGSRNHPGVKSHAQAAKLLTDHLRSVLA